MNKGLTLDEVKMRQLKFGLNTIVDRKNNLIFKKIIEQFSSFLIILLLCAAVVSIGIGDYIEGFLVLGIVVMNAAFGIFQELKAERAVYALKKISTLHVRVIRNGVQVEIESDQLVPDDIIFVEEGTKVPADAKLISASHIELSEALLTGESVPLPKEIGDEIYMGTIVTKGHGFARVLKTGMNTKFGEIAHQLSAVEEAKTPLQLKLTTLSRVLGIGGIFASLFACVLSYSNGEGIVASFLLASSLAVAIVPESLPAVMTVILSVGMKFMAEKNAIVRKVSAIEAIGSVTLIATDKTGTLTENKMVVKEVWFANKLYNLLHHEKQLASNEQFLSIARYGVLSSTASLVISDGDSSEIQILGDPTEGALLLMARSFKIDKELLSEEWKILDEVPFDPKSKQTSAAVESHGVRKVIVKGAPEEILRQCTHIVLESAVIELNELMRAHIFDQIHVWAQSGLRVLAVAEGSEKGSIKRLLGLVAIHDNPRNDVLESIQRALLSGIKVVMITGDNEQTAESIGKAVGLFKRGDLILTGAQVDNYSDTELLKILPNVKIFARTTPVQKYKIVLLYQSLGEIVAVTGDGVNDAIALKQADVGIAMGKCGTDVAREAADIVILDDHFKTIIYAVEEGRNIVSRLKHSIIYLLTGNLIEALTILIGLLLGFPPIFLPIQLLYINLISDGIPSIAFAFLPKDDTIMHQMRRPSSTFLVQRDYLYILSSGLFGSFYILSIYFINSHSGGHLSRSGPFAVVAMLQTFIFLEIWGGQLNLRKKIRSFLSPIFFATILLPIGLQYIISRSTLISAQFHTVPLSSLEFCIYLSISASFIFPLLFFREVYYQRRVLN